MSSWTTSSRALRRPLVSKTESCLEAPRFTGAGWRTLTRMVGTHAAARPMASGTSRDWKRRDMNAPDVVLRLGLRRQSLQGTATASDIKLRGGCYELGFAAS